MGPSRRIAAVVIGVVLAGGLAILPSTAAAAPTAAIGGVVRDALGKTLEGVEVLVLSEESTNTVGSAVTDEAGRFRVTDLPTGLYRVAALKPGYLATVTRANTFLRSTVDVVLRPAPRPGEAGAENVTERPTWVLRVPRRSLLRDTEIVDLLRDHSAPDPSAPSSRDAATMLASRLPGVDLVEGEFRHLVALGASSPQGGGRSGPVVGGETSMQLTSALGQRGSLRLQGRRESLEASGADLDRSSGGSRSTKSLAFDLMYDTSRDSRVGVSAYFAQGDVRVGVAPEAAVDDGREARRAWGYDATWTMQLDRASRVAVSLGYRDASIDVPDSYLRGLGIGDEVASRSVSNRAIGATGSYEVQAGDDHLVRVGARAQRIDLAIPLVRDGGDAMFVALPGGAGWSVRLDAEDAWSVTAPWTVVYGLGVQQVLDGPGETLVVPRTGAVFSPGPVDLRVLVSYHAMASWGGPQPGDPVDPYGSERLRPARPLGWEAEVEAPLAGQLSVRATHRYEPLHDATRSAGAFEPEGEASLVVQGGNASDSRSTVALTHRSGRASTSVAWTWGQAEGLIGQSAGFDLPVQILAERRIAYRSGRVEVRFPEPGTDVTFEYRRFAEGPVSRDASPFENSYVELAMGQQVAHLARLGATCRLLLAARLAPAAVEATADSAQNERARTIAALNQRISAGLLVTF